MDTAEYPRPKTKAQLREAMRDVNQTIGDADPERSHAELDALLLRYINDAEITAEFNAAQKWYA